MKLILLLFYAVTMILSGDTDTGMNDLPATVCAVDKPATFQASVAENNITGERSLTARKNNEPVAVDRHTLPMIVVIE